MTERKQDFVLRVNVPVVGELSISPSCDYIKRYDEDKYDHLVYVGENEHGFTHSLMFLGKVALDILAEYGVGETFHDAIYNSEHEQYENWQILSMEQYFEDGATG